MICFPLINIRDLIMNRARHEKTMKDIDEKMDSERGAIQGLQQKLQGMQVAK